MTRRARAVLLLAAMATLVVVGCGGSSPPAPLPAEKAGAGVVYVALGGDDNVGGRSTFADAWPQRLFRALTRASTFVNLADARSGSAEILADQVGAAIALRPDLVTITLLDDAERTTDPAVVEENLRAAVDRLARRSGTTILVGTTPSGIESSDLTAPLDAAIRRAVGGRATVVDLGGIAETDRDARAAAIARAFSRALPRTLRGR